MHSFVQFPATFFRFQIPIALSSPTARALSCHQRNTFIKRGPCPQPGARRSVRAMAALPTEVAIPVETTEWPSKIGHAALAMPPICEKCGAWLAFVGKLPAIRLQPLLKVYKCSPCNHVVTIRP